MKLFLTISFIFLLQEMYSQNKLKDSTKVYSIVQKMPEPKGGQVEMLNSMMKKIKLDSCSYATSGYFSFIVNIDGALDSLKVLRSTECLGLDEEFMKFLKNYPWIPGEHDSEKVPVKVTLPVRVHFR